MAAGLLRAGAARGWFVGKPDLQRLEEWHRLYDEQLLESGDPRAAIAVADRGAPRRARVRSLGEPEPRSPDEGGRVVDEHEQLKLDHELLQARVEDLMSTRER